MKPAWRSLVGLTLAFLALTACEMDPDAPGEFVAVLPLTGDFAAVGTPKREGMTLAFEHLGRVESDGPDLSLTTRDSRGETRTALAIIREALGRGAPSAFYIDLTPIAAAALPLVDEASVPAFLGTAHPTLIEQSSWAFRFFPSGMQESELLLDHLRAEEVGTVFVLHTSDPYGENVRDQLRRLGSDYGVSVTGSESFNVGQADVRGSLARAREAGADRILLIGYGITFPTILRQSNELGIAPRQVLGNIGFVGNPTLATMPELTDGIVFTTPHFLLPEFQGENAQASNFVETYRSRFGQAPTFMAAYAYDSVLLLQAAGRMAGGWDPEALREALLSLEGLEGVTGRISITPEGDSYTDMILAEWRDGELVRSQFEAAR